MALKIQAKQNVFHYKTFHIDKSQPLGRGSYGAVYKAKCDQLPCAAKILHPTILDPTDPGADKILERFHQECAFLGSIRHPHIVQYLGLSRDSESKLPVLLMELLDESLTKMLEHSQQPLAYSIQVDICHDIALAVAYLHSNDIIHRDLSSNNVLIMTGRRAKVTDFGMSKLAGAVPATTSFTVCPGTLAYMPPEALKEPPTYTNKLDCFSEGVIMIQVCTRLWPEPGPRTQAIPDSRSPTGSIEMPVLDVERRKNHIDLIESSHPFMPLIEKCLSYSEDKRPSANDLCQKLADLKTKKDYGSGKEKNYSDLKRQIQKLHISEEGEELKDQRIQKLEEELAKTSYDLKHQSEIVVRYREAIQQMKATIEAQEQEIHEKTKEIKSKDKQVEQLNGLLNQQQQITAEFQQKSKHLLRELDETKKESHHLVEDDRQSDMCSSMEGKLQLRWRGEEEAPEPMLRGTAVSDGDIVYFMHQYLGKVYSYNSATKRWTKLLYCPHKESSLTVVRGQLTTIGGRKFELLTSSERILNELLSLCVTVRGEEWVEQFPPMPTKRYGVSTLTAASCLIVAGGITVHGDSMPRKIVCTTAVEVLSIKSLVWSTVARLPHPYTRASAAIYGDQLFLLGGDHQQGEKSLSAIVCSLTELLQSNNRSSPETVWKRITDTPLYYSTCVEVNGEILTVGGQDINCRSSAAVYKYDPTTNSWDAISHMLSARHSSLVATLPKQLIVVGGESHLCDTKTTNIVEVADF